MGTAVISKKSIAPRPPEVVEPSTHFGYRRGFSAQKKGRTSNPLAKLWSSQGRNRLAAGSCGHLRAHVSGRGARAAAHMHICSHGNWTRLAVSALIHPAVSIKLMGHSCLSYVGGGQSRARGAQKIGPDGPWQVPQDPLPLDPLPTEVHAWLSADMGTPWE